MNRQETWVPIPCYEGVYEVSDLGGVRSIPRVVRDANGRRARNLKGKLLQAHVKASGHLQITLCKNGVARAAHVHRLVAESFVAGRSPGDEVCHINGDPSDNMASNLRWGSRQSNVDDMIRAGTASFQKMTHCRRGHKYTEENTYIFPDGKSRRCRTCRRMSKEGGGERTQKPGRGERMKSECAKEAEE